ncbi:hypothetical protein [Limimaricola sp.]|uniref:hypothetical protein n=1 Tax=Limimaricola sp. TaxID=2211665 RepID=UPI004057FA1D
MDITTKHKDEEIIVDVLLQDAAGSPIANPASHTVSIVISAYEGGLALAGAKYDATLADAGAARFRRVLSPADLAALAEEFTYYYVIWSKEGAAVPVMRAKGKLSLLKSISLPA